MPTRHGRRDTAGDIPREGFNDDVTTVRFAAHSAARLFRALEDRSMSNAVSSSGRKVAS